MENTAMARDGRRHIGYLPLTSGAVIVAATLAWSLRLASFMHAKELVLAAGRVVLAALAVARGHLRKDTFHLFVPLWFLLLWAALWHLIQSSAHGRPAAAELVSLAAALGFVCLWRGLSEAAKPVLTETAPQAPGDVTGPPLKGVAPQAPGDVTGPPLKGVAPQAPGDVLDQNHPLIAFLIAGWFVALLALAQYAKLLPFAFPDFPGYDQRMYSVFGNQDLLGGFLAPLLPVACVLVPARRYGMAVIVLTPMLLALALSGSRSAWLAAAAGLALCLWRFRRRKGRVAATAGLVLAVTVTAILLSPESTVRRVTDTFGHGDVGGRARLWFWDASLRMLRDYPLGGVGPGNYGFHSPRYQGEALRGAFGAEHYRNEEHTLHAHSEPLEIACEYGLPGLALSLWMLLRAARRGVAHPAALAAFVTFALLNTVTHSPPHALLGLALLLPKQTAGAAELSPRMARIAAFAAIVLAAGALGFTVAAVTVPSMLLRAAMDTHLQSPERALPLYARAEAYRWRLEDTRYYHGLALLDTRQHAEAEGMLDRALATCDTGGAYLALGAARVARGRLEEAVAPLEACVWRWPGNGEAWRLLFMAVPRSRREAVLSEAARWLDNDELSRMRPYSSKAGVSTP